MPSVASAPVADTAAALAATLAAIRTESGASLLALSEASPVLLVFLRHFGCPFGRKTIGDIAELHPQLDALGVRPVFVHLGTPELAKPYFEYYNVSHVERVSDPEAAVYRLPHFALGKSSKLWDLIHPKVWLGWLKGGTVFKHGIGKYKGDGTQMPGIFFVKGSTIVRRFQHRNIADQPDYLSLIR